MTTQTQTAPPMGECQTDKDLQSKPDCPLADFVFKSLSHLSLPSFGATLYTHLCLTKNLLIKECDINRI